jgi:bile acid:Na+ symporter, BASS family
MDSELFTVFLPLTLALMMMGLGLHLRPADFYRLTLHPKVIFIALFSQLVLLVGIAFLICQFLNLAPIFAIGLMLVAASPGGPTSNLFTYLFKGDVALNITLTATNRFKLQTNTGSFLNGWKHQNQMQSTLNLIQA